MGFRKALNVLYTLQNQSTKNLFQLLYHSLFQISPRAKQIKHSPPELKQQNVMFSRDTHSRTCDTSALCANIRHFLGDALTRPVLLRVLSLSLFFFSLQPCGIFSSRPVFIPDDVWSTFLLCFVLCMRIFFVKVYVIFNLRGQNFFSYSNDLWDDKFGIMWCTYRADFSRLVEFFFSGVLSVSEKSVVTMYILLFQFILNIYFIFFFFHGLSK